MRFLLNIIDKLPAHSRYAEAVASDRELAAETLWEDPPEPSPPPLSSWTPEVAELRIIAERLGAVAQLVAVLSRNHYDPPLLPRPVSARREVWLEQNLSRHRQRVARMISTPQEDDDAVPG